MECQPSKIEFRIRSGYLDTKADNLDEALEKIQSANATGRPLSVGLLGNVIDVLEEIKSRGLIPDVLTDQTSAHDELNQSRDVR